MDKMVIYQVFPRWFGNLNTSLINNGTKAENGVGKFSDFTPLALRKIKELGITHVWYTGVIEHATKTDYSTYGIRKDHAAVVKGNAGSPYAIKDYYDIDPALVPKWKKVVADRQLSPVSTNNQLDKREYVSKDTPLRKATRQINDLENQGISVSYGQAVAMGLIPG